MVNLSFKGTESVLNPFLKGLSLGFIGFNMCSESQLNTEQIDFTQATVTKKSVHSSPACNGEIINLHRGCWATSLTEGQLISIGGHALGDTLSLKIQLDFKTFEDHLEKFTPEIVREHTDKQAARMAEWMTKNKISGISPELYLKLFSVQAKVDKLLAVTESSGDSAERQKMFTDHQPPLLSSLVGKSACVERALLGKHLLDRIDQPAVYMSGVYTNKFNRNEEATSTTDHSFLIIPEEGQTVIFDIARKHQGEIPRVAITALPISIKLFLGEKNMLVEAKNVYSTSNAFYGVGNPYLLQRAKAITFA